MYETGSKRKSALDVVTKGEIAAHCQSHTGEEWLKIMQAKSNAQGKKLSWYQIKQDPELNHQEIMEKLGTYANYENQLFKVAEKAEPNLPVLPKKPRSEIIWLKDHKTLAKRRQQIKPVSASAHFAKIEAPEFLPWEDRGIILISQIGANGEERHLNLSQIDIIQSVPSFTSLDLQRLFAGLGNICTICGVSVSGEKISTKLRWCDGTKDEDKSTVEFRILPQQKARLFIGLILTIDKFEYETYDYIICDCKGAEGEQQVKIIQEKHYDLSKFKDKSHH